MPPLLARATRSAFSLLPLYNGKGRIIDRSFLSTLRFPEQELRVETIDGAMWVNPNDLVGRTIYLTRTFDRCVADVLAALARPGDTLWDLGANIGYISVAFLSRVPRGRVVAVEPLHDVFAMLEKNVPRDRGVCLRCAVSDHPGSGSMIRTPGNLGGSHLGQGGGGADGHEGGESVALKTGEQIMEHGAPAVVKIDTEGHELSVLRGMGPALDHARAIVFECHQWPNEDIRALLEARGFTILNLCKRWSGWKLCREGEPPRGYESSNDLVAVRDVEAAMRLGR